MASPRNNTPKTPSSDYFAILDAPTKELFFQLDDLILPFEELTLAAQKCYEDRGESDKRAMAHNKARRSERTDIALRLKQIQEKTAQLKEQQKAIMYRIPPHLLSYANNSVNTETELDLMMLQVERQNEKGVWIMCESMYDEIINTSVDVKGIPDAKTRTDLQGLLDKFRGEFDEFQADYSHQFLARSNAVREEISDLQTRLSKANTADGSSSSSANTPISNLELGEPSLVAGGKKTNESIFRFERNNPPS